MHSKSAVLLATAILGLTLGAAANAAQPEDSRDPPGFNELDKDNDGALSRSETAANSTLTARFAQVDEDGDGRITRMEYLKAMAKQDVRTLRERAAEIIDPDPKPGSASGASR